MKNQFELERSILLGLQSKREISNSLQNRSNIVLNYEFKGMRKIDIKAKYGFAATTIDRWLHRWEFYESDRKKWYKMNKAEKIDRTDYIDLLYSIFKDSVRPGTPVSFDEKTKEKIVALAVTDPVSLGLPFTRWSEVLLQKELVKRKIVKSISTSHIGRILKKSQDTTSSK